MFIKETSSRELSKGRINIQQQLTTSIKPNHPNNIDAATITKISKTQKYRPTKRPNKQIHIANAGVEVEACVMVEMEA